MHKAPIYEQLTTADLFPLQVEKLSYRASHESLINQLSFTIDKPGVTAIMGPNGAGKSLTLRLLHGLLEPTNGHIKWGNCHRSEQVFQQQAMVFQKPILLRRTVLENLTYTFKIKGTKDKNKQQELINQALNRAKLTTQAKSPARQLSGGEQQRLVMARALMHHPAILFLDEPTSSLDPNATQAVESLIKTAANEETKIIIVTHDIGQARRISDEIIFLNKGKLIEQAPTTKLIEKPNSKAAKQYFSGKIVTED